MTSVGDPWPCAAGENVPGKLQAGAKMGESLPQSVPLPLQYPANLLYANSMVAICTSTLQQVELNIALLQLHLHQREAAAVASAQAVLTLPPAVLGLVPEASADKIVREMSARAAARASDPGAPEMEARLPPAAVPAAGAAMPDAAADPAAAAAQPPQLRVHRHRLAVAVKIALIMVLLEFRAGWFIVYFFMIFLYIGGMFDPMVEWFHRHSQQATLEEQLLRLRNRQRQPAFVRPQPEEVPVVPDAGVAAPDAGADGEEPARVSDAANRTDDNGERESPAAASAADADATGGTGGEVPDDAGAAAEGHASAPAEAPSTGATNAEEQPPAAPPPPPWAHRFFYQLVVMFFMTLLPWWNPDPRYSEA